MVRKEKLSQIRKEKQLSQEELAMLCGVSKETISAWENGHVHPDRENLEQLSRVLNIRVEELIKEETDHKRMEFVYHSKLHIFGLPLIDINLGSFRSEDHWRVAKGVLAIGNVAVGVFSMGILSLGIISVGLLTLGVLFSVGVLSLGYMAVGALAIGYIGIGAMAIGVYSLGELSIGFHVSIGAIAYGDIAIGTTTMGTHVYHLHAHRSCILNTMEYHQLHDLLNRETLPRILEAYLSNIPHC